MMYNETNRSNRNKSLGTKSNLRISLKKTRKDFEEYLYRHEDHEYKKLTEERFEKLTNLISLHQVVKI